MQTQSWRDGDAPSVRPSPQYSFAAVRHLVARLTEHDSRWAELLAAAPRPVLQVTYEELATDLPGALERTLAHVGVAPPAAWPPPVPPMRRQADELSETWIAAYERDLEPLPTAT
jgi:LPS sulfotransferase NodH